MFSRGQASAHCQCKMWRRSIPKTYLFVSLLTCLLVCLFSSNELKRRIFMKRKGIFSEELLFDWFLIWLFDDRFDYLMIDQAQLSAECKTKRVLVVSADELGRMSSDEKIADWRLICTRYHSIALRNQFVLHIWSSRDSLTPPKVKGLPDNCSRDLPSVAYLQNSLFSSGISPYKSWFSGSAKFGKVLVSLGGSRKLCWPHRAQLWLLFTDPAFHPNPNPHPHINLIKRNRHLSLLNSSSSLTFLLTRLAVCSTSLHPTSWFCTNNPQDHQPPAKSKHQIT
jgi:hypothetical protein